MKVQPSERVQNMITGLLEIKEEVIQKAHPGVYEGLLVDIAGAIKLLNKIEKLLNS